MITRRAALTHHADFSRTDPAAVALLDERWARRYGVLPLRLEEGSLVVATSDPLDLDAERAVAFATGHRVRWVEASSTEIAKQIARWYPEIGTRAEPAAFVGIDDDDVVSEAERGFQRFGQPAFNP